MILFCEDCGGKNRVDRSGLRGERVRFTCRECGYVNSYLLPQAEDRFREKTDRILDGMGSFPEIIGGFSFHTQKGILSSRMPSILKQTDIDTLGREFSRAYIQGGSSFADVTGMQIRMADKYFIVHNICTGLFLVIVSRTPCLPRDVSKLISEFTDQFLPFASDEETP